MWLDLPHKNTFHSFSTSIEIAATLMCCFQSEIDFPLLLNVSVIFSFDFALWAATPDMCREAEWNDLEGETLHRSWTSRWARCWFAKRECCAGRRKCLHINGSTCRLLLAVFVCAEIFPENISKYLSLLQIKRFTFSDANNGIPVSSLFQTCDRSQQQRWRWKMFFLLRAQQFSVMNEKWMKGSSFYQSIVLPQHAFFPGSSAQGSLLPHSLIVCCSNLLCALSHNTNF